MVGGTVELAIEEGIVVICVGVVVGNTALDVVGLDVVGCIVVLVDTVGDEILDVVGGGAVAVVVEVVVGKEILVDSVSEVVRLGVVGDIVELELVVGNAVL